MPLNVPPQVPPTDAVYPLFGVTVTVAFALLFTICDAGLTVPPVPAVAVTVHVWRVAEQFAVVPLFDPVQLHVHGPLPLTAVAVPALQRFAVGAVVNTPPFDDPQAPFTGFAVKVAVTEQLLVTAFVV